MYGTIQPHEQVAWVTTESHYMLIVLLLTLLIFVYGI